MKSPERLFNRNFILISIATLLMFTGFYLVMPIIARYVVEEFDADASVAGVVAAAYIISALLIRPFSGYLVDRFDRRKFYLITFTIFSTLFVGYIISVNIAQLIITRILLGACFALVTTAANTLAIDIMPSTRRGEGIGYFGAITVLAMAVGPMAGLYLIEVFTYNELFIIATLCCWVGVGIGCFVRTKPRETVVHEALSLDRFFLRDGLSMASIISIMYFFYGSLMVYVSLYIKGCGVDVNSGNFFLLFAIGIIAARILSAKALRRGLNDMVVKLGSIVIILSGVIFALYLSEITFSLTAICLGLGFGMLAPAIQSMIIDLVPASRRGTANSTYFIALDCGSGLGMLLGGTIAHLWSFSTLFLIGVGFSALALLLYLCYSRRDYERRLAATK